MMDAAVPGSNVPSGQSPPTNGQQPQPVSLRLPADRASVAQGRMFLEQTVRRWGLDINLDDAKLLLTELITNALVHAGTGVQLQVWPRPGVLVVAVVDEGDHAMHAMLARLPKTELSIEGRGLAIVSKLAKRWGVDRLPDGNRVWFELADVSGGAVAPPSPAGSS